MVAAAFYTHFFEAKEELNQNNRIRREQNHRLIPLDRYLVEPLSNCVAERVMLPFLRVIYQVAQVITVKTFAKFNPERAKAIEASWYDPVSTETLIRLNRKVHNAASLFATREPTGLPLVAYPDACLVVAARHLYLFTKDIDEILSVPQLLREKADRICIIAEEEVIHPPSNEKEASTYTEAAMRLVGTGYTSIRSMASLLALRIGNATKEKIRRDTHALIIRKERHIRKRLVAGLARKTCLKITKGTARSLIRGGVGLIFYYAVRWSIESMATEKNRDLAELIHQIAKTTSLFLTLMGVLLWIRCLAPSCDRLYRARTMPFDPEASTSRQIRETLQQSSMLDIIGCAQAILIKQNPNEGRLQAFLRRVNSIKEKES